MAYQITAESTCDLPYNYYTERNIACIGLAFVFDGKEYLEGPDQEMSSAEVYARMRNKERCTTNQANAYRFIEFFEPILQSGNDILHIGFSSGLSGTYQSCLQAAEELSERYPERTVTVVDSLCASLGQGLLVHLAADNRDNGMSLQDNAQWVENNKLNIAHWFTVDDLMFLHRGGRVPKTSAIVGSLLGIKPVLHVDNEGHLIAMSKVRGREASLKELVNRMKTTMTQDPQNATVFISHGDCEEDAQKLAQFVKAETGASVSIINCLGSVIGSHAGPGTAALFFLTSER